jgi:hypothetical protein
LKNIKDLQHGDFMLIHFKNLFTHHDGNNHKPKILHLSSLSVFIILLFLFQLFITYFHNVEPGVLGFASNINPQSIVDLTNQTRASLGLGTLALSPTLSEAAREKAADMFAKGYWAHFSPTGTSPWWFFKNVGYNYLYAGENLARDFNDSGAVVNAWMNSPTHKDNIVSPHYKEIGVAVVDGVLNGEQTTLVVQLFGTPGGIAAVGPGAAKGASEEATLPEVIQNKQLSLIPSTFLSQTQKTFYAPLISSLTLTKIVNVSVLTLLLAVLAFDAFIVWKRKIVRIGGKSFIHFSFLAIILAVIILTTSGQII